MGVLGGLPLLLIYVFILASALSTVAREVHNHGKDPQRTDFLALDAGGPPVWPRNEFPDLCHVRPLDPFLFDSPGVHWGRKAKKARTQYEERTAARRTGAEARMNTSISTVLASGSPAKSCPRLQICSACWRACLECRCPPNLIKVHLPVIFR